MTDQTPPPPPAEPIEPFNTQLPDVECPLGHVLDEECMRAKKAKHQPKYDAEQDRYHRVKQRLGAQYIEDFEAASTNTEKRAIQQQYELDKAALKAAHEGEMEWIRDLYKAEVLRDCCEEIK